MTKESVYIRKELNSQRIDLVQQHDKRKCLRKKRVKLPQKKGRLIAGSHKTYLVHQHGRRLIVLEHNIAAMTRVTKIENPAYRSWSL